METRHDQWRPVVNGILYGVQFADELTDELVDRTAHRIQARPLAGLTAEDQYAALATAVTHGDDLTCMEGGQHGEPAVRAFLARVLDRLDALHPWQDQPYQVLNLSRWDQLDTPAVIARILISTPKVEQKIGLAFWRLDDLQKRAAMLQLHSGAVVALVAHWWPESNAVALAISVQQDPAAVIAELLDSTDLSTDDIAPIDS